MKKSRSSVSDIFVQKIGEKSGKLMTREDIADIWIMSGGSKSRVAYGIGKAKGQGVVTLIGGGIFYILEQNSGLLSSFAVLRRMDRSSQGLGNLEIDDHYWQIVALLIRQYSPSGAIIAHEKSMEIHLRDYSIPSRLVLYTRDTQKRIQIGKYDIHFRTLQTGEKSGTRNMYRILSDMSEEGMIDDVSLRYLGLESSLLDVASLRIHDSGIAEALILRFLERYSSRLSRDALGELVKYRYIRALNRVRSLSKSQGYIDLYENTLDIIRKEGGGCYLNL